jgi:hypothetical protein
VSFNSQRLIACLLRVLDFTGLLLPNVDDMT